MNDAASATTDDRKIGEVGLTTSRDFTSSAAFTFENGQKLPGFRLRYETYGRLNAQKTNTILICHPLSGDHHCAGIHQLHDPKPGWWNHVIGPGKPIDTTRFYVVSSNCLGGCQGSTGPSSINSCTGKPYNLDFPLLTIGDMVRAQHRLMAEHLGLPQLYAVVGGSMGGMQALQWGITYPSYVRRLIALATTGRSSAQAIAFNEVGRCAIMQDVDWQNGNYPKGHGPHVGLAVARMMAHITYLSDKGMEHKFGRERADSLSPSTPFDVEFEVESYLRHQGRRFVNRFDANTYLYFTKALDRFDLYGENGRLEDTLQTITAKTLVIGFTSDRLYPTEQNQELVHALLRCSKDASYAQINTDLGHDSFLVHSPELYALLRAFLHK